MPSTIATIRPSRPHADIASRLMGIGPGLLLCAACAAGAQALARTAWMQVHGLGALTIAIALGMLLANGILGQWEPHAARLGPGIALSRHAVLRTGVVLYGLRLTIADIGQVGAAGILIDALMLGSTFALGLVIGTRFLGLDRCTAILIGAGSAICGAAAVLATAPLARARTEQIAVAVATVVLFGTVSVFLYPALFQLNRQWHVIGGGAAGFGIYIGSTVHEVAQVAAAARSVDERVADAAVIAKMVRVMMLAPFLAGLAAWLASRGNSCDGGNAGRARAGGLAWQHVPWFALGFVGLVLVNSALRLPVQAHHALATLDDAILATAMAGLGLGTRLRSVRDAGLRPMVLALILFIWLVAGGALVNRWVPAFLPEAHLVPTSYG